MSTTPCQQGMHMEIVLNHERACLEEDENIMCSSIYVSIDEV